MSSLSKVNDEDVARDPWRSVYHALRTAIITGEYPPGARLVEQQLADRYRTSRGPVREALRELERSGLAVSRPRRGSFVRAISEQDIEEIYSLWTVTYELAIRRAVERMGSEERSWFEEFKGRDMVVTSLDEYIECGIELNRQVFVLANHSRLLDIYDTLMVQAHGRSVFFTAAEGTVEMDWRDMSRYIDELCDAMARCDADAAVALSDAFLNQLEVWRRRRQTPEARHT